MTETLANGYSSERTLREPTNTNMTGFRWFSKIFAPLCLDKSSLSIGRVNINTGEGLSLRAIFIMNRYVDND